jgi:hypothetical protein
MTPPRVLVVLTTDAAWSRGILRGFVTTGHERGWTLLHYHPPADPEWLKGEWTPDAAVVGPEMDEAIQRFAPAALVSVAREPGRARERDRERERRPHHLLARGDADDGEPRGRGDARLQRAWPSAGARSRTSPRSST